VSEVSGAGMRLPPEIRPRRGTIAPEVTEELPGLGLHWVQLAGRDGRSAPEMVARLQQLANGFRGPAVIAMRTKPVPAAYRNFFRQIGLDPDVTRPPGEQAALSRLFHGTLRPEGKLADALLVALVETGVPIWALDAGRANGAALSIRTARPQERLGPGPGGHPLAKGTLVVADDQLVHAILFGARSPDSAVRPDTRELVLFAVSVEGVPLIHVEEAFWLATEALRDAV
jgi:DNA/RNA-binding domain of Phe-tRNA-synthetase-like protein